ncbi:MAG: RNA methyltransferase [Planctomycetaceae bacterium]
MTLELRNPHSILAVFETRPEDVLELSLGAGRLNAAWSRVQDQARRYNVAQLVPQNRGGGRRTRSAASSASGRSGAGLAVVRPRLSRKLDELFDDQPPPLPSGLWLALDCLQDPHNVGAIFRSAAFFGVRGIVVSKDRSAPLNATVYDVAAGGLEHVPFALVPNLARALKQSKKRGAWLLGTSEHADVDVTEIDRDRAWMIAVGNEETGLRRLTRDHCDQVCRISPRGSVTSLNVSVATGCLVSLLSTDVAGARPARGTE